MATTSPDNIRTPNSGDQYALVQDLGTLADTVQNALIKRANAYVGTVAQRTAFTSQAPTGTIWSDTDGERLVWKKGATEWSQVSPPPQTAVVNFVSPYRNYTESRPGIKVSRQGGLVSIEGTASVTGGSSAITLDNTMAVLPEWSRPERQVYFGMFQGSSESVWHLELAPSGELKADRYRPSSTGTNLWLPFSASYPI